MHGAVVRDRQSPEVADDPMRSDGQPPAEQVAEAIAEELHDAGHTAIVCDGDEGILSVLADFMPDHHGCPTGLVFNLVRRTRGEAQRAQVPALLELAGVPYTGATPLGHSLTVDHAVLRSLLHDARVPTPNYWLLRYPGDTSPEFSFPLVVRSRFADSVVEPCVVRSAEELNAAVAGVIEAGEREALVEELVEGISVKCALLGNDDEMEFLPLADEDESGRRPGESGERVTAEQAIAIREMALTTFGICRCQDFASLDIRIERGGTPVIVGVDSMPPLGLGGWYSFAASNAGYTRPALVEKIVDVAYARYFGVAAPRFDVVGEGVRVRVGRRRR